MLLCSHCLTTCRLLCMEEKLVQLNFSVAFGRVSQRGLLYKLRSIGVGGQFLSIVSQFLSDGRTRVGLNSKVNVSVDMILGVPQSRVLGSSSSFILLGTICYGLCSYS